ncbi:MULTISPECIES: sulfotransferase [unclassified Shewanella]|uniref:sulfotransferase n=1 Tax=unclassified Shewanella TaxID=196818 RepID=UPI001BC520E5|nr:MULTISPECIES: sulfotransferase [unclassified Shewanella]GIU10961.1 sulfotransferase family protein [Shewanella sp. MBTL60-112-B1]GIU33110.1 sulfotransferase family protein [Shewanella sp. MBTL60-112-B2]
MNKVFIIGLPRTGTTSISVAMLDYGFKVAHTAYTQEAFHLADIVSDAPCFSDYQQLDKLFPGAKFVYLERDLSLWIPSMQMLINKMKTQLDPEAGIFNPVLKRSFIDTFKLTGTAEPDNAAHLEECYLQHKQQVLEYFAGRDDLICIDISHKDSLSELLGFLGVTYEGEPQFPHLNIGRKVACWKEHKHPNKVNANSAGPMHRKFFDYAAKR